MKCSIPLNYTQLLPKYLSIVLCASVYLMLSHPCFAQEEAGEESEQEIFDDKRGDISIDQETLDKAESAFFEGLTAYRAKKYTEAAKLFEAAHTLVPFRDLLFNIARSYEALGNRNSAVKYYKMYLATKPIDETQVIHRMRELGVSQFEENSKTEQLQEKTLKTKTSSVGETDFISWGIMGSGVALMGVGAYFGVSALDQAERARDASVKSRYKNAKSQAETDALLADISISVGIATVVGGLYLLLSGDQSENQIQGTTVSPTASATRTKLQWQVTYTNDLQGIGLSGSF